MQKHTKDTDLFGKNKDSAYGSHGAALMADGSVLVCGHNGNNKLDTEGWELMH